MNNSNSNNSNQIKIQQSDLNLNNAPSAVGEAQIAGILGTVYLIAGVVAVVAIIIGGVRYIASNGDSSQIQAAKNTIMYAVVGLIVVILAAVITRFVIDNVAK